MTDRQQAFVAHYLTTLNAADAARLAGYPAKTADRMGHENLKKPEIAAAVRVGKRAQLAAADLSAARTLEELRRIAFADPRQVIAGGHLLPLEQFSDELASAIASVKIIKRNLTSGDGQVDEIHEVKFWDKVRAIEQLAKHFGLLVERIEHTGSVDLVHRLQAARLRGKPMPDVLVEATPVEE